MAVSDSVQGGIIVAEHERYIKMNVYVFNK